MREVSSAARYASSASTMIRSRGSVPDGRMSTRPRPSTSVRQGLDRAREVTVVLPVVAGRNALVDEYLRQKLQVGRQFGKAPAAAAAWRRAPEGRSRCRRPSSGGRAQECGPTIRRRKAQPFALELLEHVAVADLGAHEEGRRVRRSGARGRSLVISVPTTPATGPCNMRSRHDHVEEFVTVVDVALGVRHDQAVRVARRGSPRRRSRARRQGARGSRCGSRPPPSLMLRPSGVLPTATTSAPSSWKTSGAM